MTTDPRLAPLIEALEQADAMVRRPADGTTRRRHRTGANYRRDFAATLLLLLPPDWCRHDGDAHCPECIHHGAAIASREYEPELARLRAIEEAAIDLIANTEVGAWPVSDNLRAALGSER